jgi:hypothetical protein
MLDVVNNHPWQKPFVSNLHHIFRSTDCFGLRKQGENKNIDENYESKNIQSNKLPNLLPILLLHFEVCGTVDQLPILRDRMHNHSLVQPWDIMQLAC